MSTEKFDRTKASGAWKREFDEFSDFSAQLLFDAMKALLLIGLFWLVSHALQILISTHAGETNLTSNILHFFHSMFLIAASILTLAYTLLRIAIGPLSQLYETSARLRQERNAERDHQFLDIEIELQAALIRESRTLRFQGFRMNEALKRPDFFSALGSISELKLIFMAPHESPADQLQKSHNRKFFESVELLHSILLSAPGIQLDLRTSLTPPSENILIFDEDRARVRPVKPGNSAASHNDLRKISRGRNTRELELVLSRFNENFEKATPYPLHDTEKAVTPSASTPSPAGA